LKISRICLLIIYYVFFATGFRDSIQILCEKKLNPKIPTCTQLEIEKGKRLTVKQTSESRQVTKCRFIVENKIGEIKRNHALNKNLRRNTEIGHLALDYRIACAMINFLHRPCFTDLKKNKDGSVDTVRADKIADRLLKKCENPTENHLENILKLRLGTNAVPKIKFSDITDFPKLSKSTMISKLFFGNYYLKQSIKYLADIIKTGWVSRIDHSTLSKHPDFAEALSSVDLMKSRIIGLKMISRHQRGLLSKRMNRTENPSKTAETTKMVDHVQNFRKYYTVFIQYLPSLNRSRSIICKTIQKNYNFRL
jgi:hypothetical protein